MTRIRAKELIPLLQSYVDGKQIQVKQQDGSWINSSEPSFTRQAYEYRVRPKESISER